MQRASPVATSCMIVLHFAGSKLPVLFWSGCGLLLFVWIETLIFLVSSVTLTLTKTNENLTQGRPRRVVVSQWLVVSNLDVVCRFGV